MLEFKVAFSRKDPEINTTDCVVDKVVRLSGAEFDRFSKNLLRDWDFIRDNAPDKVVDSDGRYHCLLVVGEGKRDGILVNPEGGEYARYSAFIPNAEDLLAVGRYPALAELNKKLTDAVDFICEQGGAGNLDGRGVVKLEDAELMYGIDFMYNNALLNTVMRMLDVRPEIRDFELDKNELIVYRAQEPAPAAVDLTDPAVTRTDMYAYSYGWDGMIPLGKERALEFFDAGHQIYRLYENDAEGAVGSRAEIDAYIDFFGVEDPEWKAPEHPQPFQVFIANRELLDKGKAAGEWLALPAEAETLRGIFERIGVERPSEGAFTVTAVRVPQEYLRDYVSKYDSLDELNMLASYMKTAEDYHELEKYNAVLSSGIVKVGGNAAALINLLDSDNLDGFNLIGVKDAEALGRYYHRENNEKPDGVGFERYGMECMKTEGGAFTEWGYITFRYKELSPEYTGTVPDEYKIVGEALRGLHPKTQERGFGEKPSVLDEIRAARHSPGEPRDTGAPDVRKKKEGPDL